MLEKVVEPCGDDCSSLSHTRGIDVSGIIVWCAVSCYREEELIQNVSLAGKSGGENGKNRNLSK